MIFGNILKKAAGAAKSGYQHTRNSSPAKQILGENSEFNFNLIKFDDDGIPTGLNKKGKGLLLGATGLATLYNGINERYTNNLGTSDGRITSPTPDYTVYNQKAPSASYQSAPAGADGSLVFALDRAKNGGYL